MAISAELGPQLEAFLTKLASPAVYNSKSEVLREGVRLIQEREARLAALDCAFLGLVQLIPAGLSPQLTFQGFRQRLRTQLSIL